MSMVLELFFIFAHLVTRKIQDYFCTFAASYSYCETRLNISYFLIQEQVFHRLLKLTFSYDSAKMVILLNWHEGLEK